MSDDEKVFVSYDEAVRRLPDGDEVHTFRNSIPGLLVGSDWSRDDILAALMAAPAIEETGPQAQAARHGLAIFDHMGVLFIETREPGNG